MSEEKKAYEPPKLEEIDIEALALNVEAWSKVFFLDSESFLLRVAGVLRMQQEEIKRLRKEIEDMEIHDENMKEHFNPE